MPEVGDRIWSPENAPKAMLLHTTVTVPVGWGWYHFQHIDGADDKGVNQPFPELQFGLRRIGEANKNSATAKFHLKVGKEGASYQKG